MRSASRSHAATSHSAPSSWSRSSSRCSRSWRSYSCGRATSAGRATAWSAPPPTDIQIPEGGVLPPSPKALLSRIEAKRRGAARLHLVEPGVAVIAVALAARLDRRGGLDLVGDRRRAVALGDRPESGQQLVVDILNVGMLGLAAVGLLLVGVLAAGATSGGTRPLGIVWDIACYLPQTGHPFGPPCYAERAVPEIAGRLNAWLRRPERHAVLSAHSMGGVLAVSSLALLASVESTRSQSLSRVSLLTFGVQLRPFFGRMLPELLGRGCSASSQCHGAATVGTQTPGGPDVDYAECRDAAFRHRRLRPKCRQSGRLGRHLLVGKAKATMAALRCAG